MHLEGLAGVAQHELGGAVDLGVLPAALLVCHWPGIAHAEADEPVLDAVEALLVARQPGDRPDRPGAEEEAVREARPLP